jgi:hypothetical protein
MRAVPLNVSIRELLERAVSEMTSAASCKRRPELESFDSAFMELLTQSDQANPFLLVVGENYLNEVQQHAYYYSCVLGKRCWYLSIESSPMNSLLSMLALSSGIPIEVLLSSRIPPPYFAALNDGATELYQADCRFCQTAPMDLASLVSLAKLLRRQEGIEVLLIDALHRVEFEPGRASSPTEQLWISQAMQAVAHVGELTVVAGFDSPGVPFPDLASDSTFYCESPKDGMDNHHRRIGQLTASINAKLASSWRHLVRLAVSKI